MVYADVAALARRPICIPHISFGETTRIHHALRNIPYTCVQRPGTRRPNAREKERCTDAHGRAAKPIQSHTVTHSLAGHTCTARTPHTVPHIHLHPRQNLPIYDTRILQECWSIAERWTMRFSVIFSHFSLSFPWSHQFRRKYLYTNWWMCYWLDATIQCWWIHWHA